MKKLMMFGMMLCLGACGNKGSDPLSKYDLREGGSPDQQKETRTLLQSGKISVELVSENENSRTVVNNYVEGESHQTLVKVTVNDPKILSYTFQLTQFPHVEPPTITATATPGVYALTWAPPKGFIPPGQSGQALNVKWEVVVTQAQAPELIGYSQSGSFPINVSRSSEIPKILSFDRFEKGVEEDQLIPFSVVIEDPNSKSENQIPFVSFAGVPYLNTEAFCADFAGRLIIDANQPENPKRISATQWKFFYVMDTRNLPIDRDRTGKEDPNTASVNVCFYLAAVSGVGQTTSAKVKVNIQAKYAVQAPLLKWENSIQEAHAAQENIFKFDLGVEPGYSVSRGQITLSKLATEIKSLPGEKKIECEPGTQNSNTQSCRLTWTPACLTQSKEVELKLTTLNTYGPRKKEKIFSRKWTMTPAPEKCSPPGVPAKTPAKPQPPATTAPAKPASTKPQTATPAPKPAQKK